MSGRLPLRWDRNMMEVASNFASLQQNHELDVYGKRGVALVRGEGSRVWDDEGREYLDCIAGQGSANLGHCHPAVVDAITQQACTLISCPGAFYNDQKALLLQTLTAIAPSGLDRAFLTNSGTESVEAALKFARISTGRTRIIAAKRGFHGRTFGAMSATFNPKYAVGSHPLVPDFQHVAFNNIDALREAVNEDAAGLILEAVQGEGGVYLADEAYLAEARRLCDETGALLILDEVQTGFGRTGRMFACEHYHLQPDILCLAKSIAGGLPMGAVLVNDKIRVKVGQHGSTFGGNPLACAAANASIQAMIQEKMPENAAHLGARFSAALEAAQLGVVREVRQLGLMIGVELKMRARPVIAAMMERGVLTLPAGATVLRLLPPLNISEADMDRATQTLIQVLTEVSAASQPVV